MASWRSCAYPSLRWPVKGLRFAASHGGRRSNDFGNKSATDTYNNRIGRPAMIKMFYPNWQQKAFQQNTNGGGH